MRINAGFMQYNTSAIKPNWGTYPKPMARVVGFILRLFGYKMHYRGRRRGCSCGANSHIYSLPIPHAKRLAVYARRNP